MILSNYRVIVTVHNLAKLRGLILESEFVYGQRETAALQLEMQVYERVSQRWITC